MTNKGSFLTSGDRLLPGEYLLSTNGRHKFILQPDGNLVLYREDAPLWASSTLGKPVSDAVMQNDGNFVVYGGHEPHWATDTMGRDGAALVIQDDGNVVIYQNDAPVWATNTGG